MPVDDARAPDGLLGFADTMEARAAADAMPAPGPELHLLTFALDREEFGIPVTQVREVIRVSEITRVPQAPAHVRGVANLRGRISPSSSCVRVWGSPGRAHPTRARRRGRSPRPGAGPPRRCGVAGDQVPQAAWRPRRMKSFPARETTSPALPDGSPDSSFSSISRRRSRRPSSSHHRVLRCRALRRSSRTGRSDGRSSPASALVLAAHGTCSAGAPSTRSEPGSTRARGRTIIAGAERGRRNTFPDRHPHAAGDHDRPGARARPTVALQPNHQSAHQSRYPRRAGIQEGDLTRPSIRSRSHDEIGWVEALDATQMK